MITSQQLNATLALARQRAAIYNPPNSKRNIILEKIIVDTNAPNMSFATILKNTTKVIAGSPVSPVNLNLDSTQAQPSTTYVLTDVSGTALDGEVISNMGIPANTRTVFDDVQFLIPPGVNLAIDVAYLNLLSTIKSQFVAQWHEEIIA